MNRYGKMFVGKSQTLHDLSVKGVERAGKV